jgi:hypothetical protein
MKLGSRPRYSRLLLFHYKDDLYFETVFLLPLSGAGRLPIDQHREWFHTEWT